MFGRIPLLSHLVLDFCLLGVFDYELSFTTSIWSVQIVYFFLVHLGRLYISTNLSMSSRWSNLFLFFLIYFIYLFLAVLGLRFCAWVFSSCGERGPLFITVCRPLTVAASLVAEHRLQTRRLSSCGSRVQLLRGMWDLPRPGLKPVSPASAGRFSTTAPPGKPSPICFYVTVHISIFVISVVISPLLFLTLLIWVLSRFSLISLAKGLSSLFIFSKKQLSILWIFSMIF